MVQHQAHAVALVAQAFRDPQELAQVAEHAQVRRRDQEDQVGAIQEREGAFVVGGGGIHHGDVHDPHQQFGYFADDGPPDPLHVLGLGEASQEVDPLACSQSVCSMAEGSTCRRMAPG